MKAVVESLEKSKVNYVIFDKVRVEPTDIRFEFPILCLSCIYPKRIINLSSIKHAVDFVKNERPDSFIAVGGGSVIDTAKAANLYLSHPESDFLDFVNGWRGF